MKVEFFCVVQICPHYQGFYAVLPYICVTEDVAKLNKCVCIVMTKFIVLRRFAYSTNTQIAAVLRKYTRGMKKAAAMFYKSTLL